MTGREFWLKVLTGRVVIISCQDELEHDSRIEPQQVKISDWRDGTGKVSIFKLVFQEIYVNNHIFSEYINIC